MTFRRNPFPAVIPAQAGIQRRGVEVSQKTIPGGIQRRKAAGTRRNERHWVPACAGTTN